MKPPGGLISLKAKLGRRGDKRRSKETLMPASAIPFLLFVCAAFATFIAVVGGVYIWTNLE